MADLTERIVGFRRWTAVQRGEDTHYYPPSAAPGGDPYRWSPSSSSPNPQVAVPVNLQLTAYGQPLPVPPMQEGLWGYAQRYWTGGRNVARCSIYTNKDGHHAPGKACSCGLYALHEADSLVRAGGNRHEALGAVVAWGQIEVHPHGFRAQYAQPVVLAYDEGAGPDSVERIFRIADKYGIRAVALDDLGEAAKEFGIAVPGEMRPEAPSAEAASPSYDRYGGLGMAAGYEVRY